MTRRKVIGGIGAGLALAATGHVSAVPPTPSGSTTRTAPSPAELRYVGNESPDLVDQPTKYSRPPFKSQSRPRPGLAGKMDPS